MPTKEVGRSEDRYKVGGIQTAQAGYEHTVEKMSSSVIDGL
ncbi:MAG TPA: hypothetical protein VIJ25_20305 [Methylococcales bacterium]